MPGIMLYNPFMRKIPLLWLVLTLAFSPPGGAFTAAQPAQGSPCLSHHTQAPEADEQPEDRQTDDMHGCCTEGATGTSSQCCDHCPAPALGLLVDIRIALSATPALLISDHIQPQALQLTNLPYKPPRA